MAEPLDPASLHCEVLLDRACCCDRIVPHTCVAGVLMWSVIGGAPWGLISMLMWAFSADVWDFQLRNGTSKFPCRFVMPYALLPICAGVAAARAVHKRIVRECTSQLLHLERGRVLLCAPFHAVCRTLQLATYNKHDVAVFVAAAAFPVVVFIAGLPILTLVLKVSCVSVTGRVPVACRCGVNT